MRAEPPRLAVLTAVAGAAACAAVLHLAPDRTAAAHVVPLALVWGASVLWWTRDLRGAPSLGWLVAAAVIVRLVLVGSPPLLSDDLYRYLWEGLALNHGHNPFLEAPATISGLDDALRDRVNHNTIPSIYPPLALWWFRLLAALGGTPTVAQAATAAADVAVVVAIARGGRAPALAWVYALHPLPALESAVGAHVDIPAIALAAAGVAAARHRAPVGAWVATVAGAATKLLPVVWAPALLRGVPPARGAGLVALGTVATAALAWPVLDAGPALLEAMGTYSRSWSFNGLAFPWLEPLLGGWTRPALVAVAAVACGAALWRLVDPARVWAVVGTTFVLTSPTVHPWYVLWAVVPSLLCGHRSWAVASVPLLASYTVLLAFEPATGTWSEAPWLWWATWPPALLLLGLATRWPRDDRPTAP